MEKVVLSGVRLPEKEVVLIDGEPYEARSRLVAQRGVWPCRTYAYEIDTSAVVKGCIGRILQH